MAVAIPVIASFAAAAEGVAAIAAGTATFAAYASVAGAVLTGVGALTGSKDIQRIGAIVAIGGGLAGWAQGAGASAGVGGAEGFEGASSSAAATGAAEAAQTAPAPVTSVPDDYGNSMSVGGKPIMQTSAPQAPGAGPADSLSGGMAQAPTTVQPSTPVQPVQPVQMADGKLAEAAQGLTSADLNSWWNRAKQTASGVADFMNKNPALMKVGGDVLASMYGPQAERLDWDKSLYNRARTNLNTPVPLMNRSKP